jgi:hypothetical protein
MTKANEEKGRSTEILSIRNGKIISVEVYFAWGVFTNH